jgi:hypothetical protein
VLQIDGVPDEIRGMAEGMNFVLGEEGGLFGCRFLSFEGEGATSLHDWLTVHVIATATIRISEKEAAAIVSGPLPDLESPRCRAEVPMSASPGRSPLAALGQVL